MSKVLQICTFFMSGVHNKGVLAAWSAAETLCEELFVTVVSALSDVSSWRRIKCFMCLKSVQAKGKVCLVIMLPLLQFLF